MNFNIACGTDDGEIFTGHHFGDSKYFLIYRCDADSRDIKLIKKIHNDFKKERKHGDFQKAKAITAILEDVSVLLAFAIGPNITRMRKKYVPVISRKKNILEALKRITKIIPELKEEIKLPLGSKRKIFILE